MITQTATTGPNKSLYKPLHELQHGSSCRLEQIFYKCSSEELSFMGINIRLSLPLLPLLHRTLQNWNKLLICFSLWDLLPNAPINIAHRGQSFSCRASYLQSEVSLIFPVFAACCCCFFFTQDNQDGEGVRKKAGCNIWPEEGLMLVIHICSVSSSLFVQ